MPNPIGMLSAGVIRTVTLPVPHGGPYSSTARWTVRSDRAAWVGQPHGLMTVRYTAVRPCGRRTVRALGRTYRRADGHVKFEA